MNVKLYSNGCPMCGILKRKLDESGVCYEEHNDEDEMVELGIVQTPVLSVDGRMMDFGSAIKWVKEVN